MPKKTWNFMLDGQNIEVKADIGRRQRIWVNDELVVSESKFGGAMQDQKFEINGHPAFVRMKQGIIKNSLDLVVDGFSAETGETTQEMDPMPWWGWIFMVACGAMIIFGGALPAALGIGSAAGIYSIMRNPQYTTTQRLLFSSVITGGAWVIMIIISVAILAVI